MGVQGLWRRARRARLDRFVSIFVTVFAASGVAQARPTVENVKRVELNVHGEIAQFCALGAIDDMSFGDLTRQNLSRKARVALSCNVPFEMDIRAANGGLANDRYPQGQGPYAGTLPYTLDVSIPVLRPQSALVSRSFTSRQLMGGTAVSSAGGIALDGMDLTLSLGQPSGEAGLLAGNYGDTIVITVAPS